MTAKVRLGLAIFVLAYAVAPTASYSDDAYRYFGVRPGEVKNFEPDPEVQRQKEAEVERAFREMLASQTDDIFTPIKKGDVEAVRRLIEKNPALLTERADVGEVLPIHSAVLNHKEDIVSLLLDHGANIEAKEINGRTPLNVAALSASASMVKLLLERGADANQASHKGIVPLHGASVSGTEKIKLLLKHGADINAKDDDGKTPLIYAAYYGNLDGIEVLLSHGANRVDEDKKGMRALNHAAWIFSSDQDKMRRVRRLLEPSWFARTYYTLRETPIKLAIVIPIALLGYFFRTRLKKRQPKLIAGKRYKFSCPHCGQHISVTPDLAKTTQNCPTCTQELTVPEPGSENCSSDGKDESNTRLSRLSKPVQTIAAALLKLATAAKRDLKKLFRLGSLRAEIGKLKNVDLKKAYMALGQSAYEAQVLRNELSAQHKAVESVAARIRETEKEYVLLSSGNKNRSEFVVLATSFAKAVFTSSISAIKHFRSALSGSREADR